MNAFDAPARQAFTVDMVGREDLLNAIALNATTASLREIIGGRMSQTAVSLAAAAEELSAVSTQLQSGASEIDVIGGDVIWPAQFAANASRPSSACAWVNVTGVRSAAGATRACTPPPSPARCS